ncbi:MAG: DUF2007 domain-containing protein [Kordiimonadaceae bacterium]|nr:DUF2007 domain-containing protein [Kordiimonadaceae bacterium]
MAATFDQEDRLVPIRTALDQAEAQLLRSLLEGHGVKVFMNGEHMGSLNYAVRADLMVMASQWKIAEGILNKIATLPSRSIVDEYGDERSCSQCGSTRVHAFVGEVPTFIPGVRVAANPEDKWFHCLQCDTHYRDAFSRYAGLQIAFVWGGTLGAFFLGLYWLIDWLKWL